MSEATKTYYLVGSLVKKNYVAVLGTEVPLEMSWADGMVGVCPVFGNITDAEKHASNGDLTIHEIVVQQSQDNLPNEQQDLTQPHQRSNT